MIWCEREGGKNKINTGAAGALAGSPDNTRGVPQSA